MIERIKKLFKEEKQSIENYEKTIYLAGLILLIEAANADDEFDNSEKEAIVNLLKNQKGLTESESEELIRDAQKKRDSSVDIWEYTNLINKNFSHDKKLKLIDNLWIVIYADNKLDQYEDHLIHKIADLIHISHEELIESKLKNKPESSSWR